jgi:hypothetical protein
MREGSTTCAPNSEVELRESAILLQSLADLRCWHGEACYVAKKEGMQEGREEWREEATQARGGKRGEGRRGGIPAERDRTGNEDIQDEKEGGREGGREKEGGREEGRKGESHRERWRDSILCDLAAPFLPPSCSRQRSPGIPA